MAHSRCHLLKDGRIPVRHKADRLGDGKTLIRLNSVVMKDRQQAFDLVPIQRPTHMGLFFLRLSAVLPIVQGNVHLLKLLPGILIAPAVSRKHVIEALQHRRILRDMR